MAMNKNRRTERRGVNAVRALLEENDVIVQEIEGGSDHGEDMYATFTQHGERTGDTIAIQVKSGRSFHSKDGYSVPLGSHGSFWLKSNVPVICIVQDGETSELHWANASDQLRIASRTGVDIKAIKIDRDHQLNQETIRRFGAVLRRYISEVAELHRYVAKISGTLIDTRDYVSYFENEYGERAVFLKRPHEAVSWLLHADLDWRAEEVSAESLHIDDVQIFPEIGQPTSDFWRLLSPSRVGEVVLNSAEAFWLAGCFLATMVEDRPNSIFQILRNKSVQLESTKRPCANCGFDIMVAAGGLPRHVTPGGDLGARGCRSASWDRREADGRHGWDDTWDRRLMAK